jgi:hypothetical protein
MWTRFRCRRPRLPVKKFRLTAPYYIYRVVFGQKTIPRVRSVPGFPCTEREVWVKQRQIRDLLLGIEPGALWEKHEARRCPLCHRWFVGIPAQMQREREMCARLNGTSLVPCGDHCRKS